MITNVCYKHFNITVLQNWTSKNIISHMFIIYGNESKRVWTVNLTVVLFTVPVYYTLYRESPARICPETLVRTIRFLGDSRLGEVFQVVINELHFWRPHPLK